MGVFGFLLALDQQAMKDRATSHKESWLPFGRKV